MIPLRKPASQIAIGILYILVLPVLLISFKETQAQTFPAGFSQVKIADGLRKPTVIAFTPNDRMLVAEQEGKLWVVKKGNLLATPALNLPVDVSGERGLIGIAIDPDFSTNQYVYLYHTLPDGSRNRISRFTFEGDKIKEGSEKLVLDLDPLSSANNHNGGAMHFGKDGKLYVAIGENALPSHAQDLDTYHGNMLRINTDGSVPDGNPFSSGSEQKKRTWAYGLRNPYTFDIHPESGKIWVNDVGQSSWEEINDASQQGLNFGWPAAEGQSTESSYTGPVYAYPHGDGDGKGCAITGGVFFNPASSNYPAEYRGKYFLQDYCNGWINMLNISSTVTRETFARGLGIRTLGITAGTDGNLYYISRSQGAVFKIIYTHTGSPAITQQPTSATVTEGQAVTFEVSASGTASLSYQWQRNNQTIPGATEPEFTIGSVTPSDAGDYKVIVSDNAGEITSKVATLTVEPYDAAPVADVLTPTENSFYQAGDTIRFSGQAKDEEDGILPAGAFTWMLDFHHNDHVHDGPPIATGVKEGSFVIPNTGETSANVWYRLTLKVEDAKGLTGTVNRDIHPMKAGMQFMTVPEGLQIKLDDKALTTPASVVGVTGIIRTIGVVSPQVKNGITYTFDHWRHGGKAEQMFETPAGDATFTAVFKEAGSDGQSLTRISLINADTNEDVLELTEGVEVDLSGINLSNFNIRADAASDVESVSMKLEGAVSHEAVENKLPYALFGDDSGDYKPGGPLLAGDYTLTVTPYSEDRLNGEKGESKIIHFTVIDEKNANSTFTINTLTLIDADTNKDLLEITDGKNIDIASLNLKNFNIRADASSQVRSVRMQLSGKQAHDATENKLPYALFGDRDGDYRLGGPLLPGDYTLTVTPYSETRLNGEKGQVKTLQFSVVDEQEIEGPAVNSLTLIDADTDKDLLELTSGKVIDPAALQVKNFNIRANASSSTGSVKMVLQERVNYSTIENKLPYAIFGDWSGDYKPGQLPEGNYTLTVTPYAERGGNGTKGSARTVSFQVKAGSIDPSAHRVLNFTLVDATANQDLKSLEDGGFINRASNEDKLFNIRANTSPAQVGSVIFELYKEGAGEVRRQVENKLSYDLFGDVSDWIPGYGGYTLKATPYTERNGGGKAGIPLTIRFEVIHAVPRTMTAEKKAGAMEMQENIMEEDIQPIAFSLYPSPADKELHVQYAGDKPEFLTLSIYNVVGALVYQISADDVLDLRIDLTPYQSGVYVAVMEHGDQRISRKFYIKK